MKKLLSLLCLTLIMALAVPLPHPEKSDHLKAFVIEQKHEVPAASFAVQVIESSKDLSFENKTDHFRLDTVTKITQTAVLFDYPAKRSNAYVLLKPSRILGYHERNQANFIKVKLNGLKKPPLLIV